MDNILNCIKSYWFIFTLFVFAAITILSIWPLPKLPFVPGSDKINHSIAYAALMFPTALRKPNNWKIIGLFFIAWSGTIELIQSYVNRHGEWSDMVANATGVVCGLLIAELLIFFFPDKFQMSKKNR